MTSSAQSSAQYNTVKPNRPKFFCNETIVDEADTEDGDDTDNRVVEESPTGRWSKLDSEILVQKLPDFDCTHLGLGINSTLSYLKIITDAA
jgi:hypothetical protein